ncbi:hypothetical protein FGU65_02315 [Methanoculleus sp. FWC-SCC1]|uniref:DUF3821 domain-containing protein n=1 Tax=Methanoculleus frigidifontis TaxID=2584085 RepID=A0ABT8M739_9EURY|nr:hypothetical protein [Methanoculleus sp. FWC-SCC1]MDN7023740.1 hypothetical protein [Methanoculleus sp. FWC-SCC1]
MNGTWYAAALVCAAVIVGICIASAPLQPSAGFSAAAEGARPPGQEIPPIIVKGYPYSLSGEGGGAETVVVWLIGRNCFEQTVVDAGDGGLFSFALPAERTAGLESGPYSLIVQNPGADGVFDPGAGAAVRVIGNRSTASVDSLSAVAGEFVAVFESSEIDDTVTAYRFLLEEPWIRVDGAEGCLLPDVRAGVRMTVSGTTNLPAGELLTADFSRVEPRRDGLKVVALTVSGGDPYNAWSLETDTGEFEPGEYFLTVGRSRPGAMTVAFTVTGDR